MTNQREETWMQVQMPLTDEQVMNWLWRFVRDIRSSQPRFNNEDNPDLAIATQLNPLLQRLAAEGLTPIVGSDESFGFCCTTQTEDGAAPEAALEAAVNKLVLLVSHHEQADLLPRHYALTVAVRQALAAENDESASLPWLARGVQLGTTSDNFTQSVDFEVEISEAPVAAPPNWSQSFSNKAAFEAHLCAKLAFDGVPPAEHPSRIEQIFTLLQDQGFTFFPHKEGCGFLYQGPLLDASLSNAAQTEAVVAAFLPIVRAQLPILAKIFLNIAFLLPGSTNNAYGCSIFLSKITDPVQQESVDFELELALPTES